MSKRAPLNVPFPQGVPTGPWYDYFGQQTPYYDLLGIHLLKADSSKTIILPETAKYSKYILEMVDVVRSNSTTLLLRTSANNGGSFSSTSGDYRWAIEYPSGAAAAATTANSSSTGTSIQLSGTSSTNPIHGYVTIYSANEATTKTICDFTTLCHQTYPERVRGAGTRDSAGITNAIQILPGSNTLTSGTLLLYGLKRAF